jgi:preprotein translocase subunit SecG
MEQIIIVIHVLVSLCIIGLVLIQHGKGADAGATFGGGASNTMFGSQGPMPFLMKLTCVLVAIFFANSLALSYLVSHRSNGAAQLASAPVAAKTQSAKKPQIVFPTMSTASQGRDGSAVKKGQ